MSDEDMAEAVLANYPGRSAYQTNPRMEDMNQEILLKREAARQMEMRMPTMVETVERRIIEQRARLERDLELLELLKKNQDLNRVLELLGLAGRI